MQIILNIHNFHVVFIGHFNDHGKVWVNDDIIHNAACYLAFSKYSSTETRAVLGCYGA